MTEDYVSFETAKLLKEKGFNWNTDKQYDLDKIVGDYNITDRSRNPERYLDAPSLGMAMKWLREVHKLFIFISPWTMLENNIQYYFEIREIKTHDFETLYDYTSKELDSFEKVAEAAIKYCLENLI